MLHRFLLLLMMIRLLLPPGICLCQYNSPASRLLLGLLMPDRELPPSSAEEEDDHDPGCPASYLATGMGLHLPLVSLLPPLPTSFLDFSPCSCDGLTPPAPAWSGTVASTCCLSPPVPIYLEDRALLI